MAKYFITGVEIPIHEAYVLDISEARRAIRDLSNRIKAIEGTVSRRDPGEAGRRIRHAHAKGREIPPVSDAVVMPENARHLRPASSRLTSAR